MLFRYEVGNLLVRNVLKGKCRVVQVAVKQTIGGIALDGFGAHITDYPVPYLTAACAIGLTREEVDCFLARLEKVGSKKKQSLQFFQIGLRIC